MSYQAFVTHLASSLNMLPAHRARELTRLPLPQVREILTGTRSTHHLVVVDQLWSLPTVDVEVGTDMLLPPDSAVLDADAPLDAVGRVGPSPLLRAIRPGTCEITYPTADQSATRQVRVARFQYVGLDQYRFLEGQDDWDDEDEEL